MRNLAVLGGWMRAALFCIVVASGLFATFDSAGAFDPHSPAGGASDLGAPTLERHGAASGLLHQGFSGLGSKLNPSASTTGGGTGFSGGGVENTSAGHGSSHPPGGGSTGATCDTTKISCPLGHPALCLDTIPICS